MLGKLGGQPDGFPAEQWPRCQQCKQPMSFLGQFSPNVPRVPAPQWLYLFKCEGDDVCDFWDPNAGANACVLAVPGDTRTQPPNAETPTLLELWVGAWRGEDDGVSPELEPCFYDERFNELPDQVAYPHDFDQDVTTKAGGVPYWTGNGVPTQLPPSSRVVLQIGCAVTVEDESNLASHAAGMPTFGPGAVQIDGAEVSVANFCSDGIGYVVDIQPEAPEPEFRFLIAR